MPLFTTSGKEVPLVRPEPSAPVPKVKKKGRYYYGNQIPNGQITLPKVPDYRVSQRKTKYPGRKVEAGWYLPPLIVVTFRSYAVSIDCTLADAATDVLIYFFDSKYPGWDSQVPIFRDIDVDPEHKQNSDQRKLIGNNGLLPRRHHYNQSSHYKGGKIFQVYKVPVPVYITLRSIADVQKRPMTDIATDAMMFYFDETMPGWDLAGDIPESETNAK